jgi:hypothetical protein
MAARSCGGNVEIPPCLIWMPNPLGGTSAGRQFDWGGRLPKSNGGAQRFSQPERKPGVECNGIRELDCETDGSSRWETRP